MPEVFLSYTARDRDLAQRLVQALETSGVSVFWAHRDVQFGDPSQDSLSRALSEARIFVFLHPGQMGSSEYLRMETQAALTRSKTDGLLVLPILPPGRVPVEDIGHFRYVHLNSLEDLEPVVQEILKALRSKSGVPASTPGIYLSFISALLRTDLVRAPQAASLVLDWISSTAEAQPEDMAVMAEALDWGLAHLGPDHPAVRSCRHQLAVLLRAQGRFSEAAALGQEMLAQAANPADRLTATVNFASVVAAQNDLAGARDAYIEALQLAERLNNDPARGAVLVALGSLAEKEGDMSEAIRWYQEALGLTHNSADPSTRVSALLGLSSALVATHEPIQALISAEQGFALAQSTLGVNAELTSIAADHVAAAKAIQ